MAEAIDRGSTDDMSDISYEPNQNVYYRDVNGRRYAVSGEVIYDPSITQKKPQPPPDIKNPDPKGALYSLRELEGIENWKRIIDTYQVCMDAKYEPEEVGEILFDLVEELLKHQGRGRKKK